MKTSSNPIDYQRILNQRFQDILPQIRNCAEFAFRRLKHADREDAIQDVIAQCYFTFGRMAREGGQDRVFPTVLARFAIRRYRSGRRASGTVTKQDSGLAITERDDGDQVRGRSHCRSSRWWEFLVEDRRTPVPDQVSLRVDFPAWLSQLSLCQRRVAEMFVSGDRPVEVARAMRVSPARISQIRKGLREDWEKFHDPALSPA